MAAGVALIFYDMITFLYLGWAQLLSKSFFHRVWALVSLCTWLLVRKSIQSQSWREALVFATSAFLSSCVLLVLSPLQVFLFNHGRDDAFSGGIHIFWPQDGMELGSEFEIVAE
jgi:hypothetical protein